MTEFQRGIKVKEIIAERIGHSDLFHEASVRQIVLHYIGIGPQKVGAGNKAVRQQKPRLSGTLSELYGCLCYRIIVIVEQLDVCVTLLF